MKSIYLYICLICVSLSVASCKVYDDPDPIFEEEQSSIAINKRRVLIINVDGAIGEVVRSVMPTNIASLLPSSKYTFSSIADANTNYASTWASIAKGVSVTKHMVNNDDFSQDNDDEHLHESIPYYPSFYYRMEEVNPYYKTSIIMRDSSLARELFNEVENRKFFSTDESLVNYTENYLKTTKDMIALVQLSDVMQEGRNSGFSGTNPKYIAAINEADKHIGSLVNAVKARETYKDEEWLIIVQSNNGGTGTSTGGTDYNSKNIFMILNSPKFQTYEFLPKFISGTRFFKTSRSRTDYDANGLEATNTSAYDITNNEMSVEFFIKANEIYAPASNTFMFGKSVRTNQNSGTNEGWFFYQRSRATAFFIAFTDGTSVAESEGFPVFTKDKWDHITVTVKIEGRTAILNIYSNGTLTRTRNITLTQDNAKVISTKAFRIQHGLEHNSFHNMDVSLAEIRIFNKVLDAAQIAKHACLLDLNNEDDSYSNLVGYYPLSENFDNKISSGPNLTAMLHNNTQYPNVISTSKIATSCDIDLIKGSVISNTDVAPLTFYWLRKQYNNYGWNSFNPLKNFEIEFLGSDI